MKFALRKSQILLSKMAVSGKFYVRLQNAKDLVNQEGFDDGCQKEKDYKKESC